MSSNFTLNWCKCGLIYLQSRTNRGFPFLLNATVSGLTICGISLHLETIPLSNKAFISLSTNTEFTLAE